MQILLQITAGLALALVALTLAAQPLRDPTQPPAEAVAVDVKPVAHKGLTLQTVVISQQRRTAVISGRIMSVGDTIQGYRLVEIRESEALLRGSKGTRTLRLYPAMKKVVATTATLPEETKGRE